MGNTDTRTLAELLLAPRVPQARVMSSVSGLKLNLGGATTPGVISDPSQLAGPIRSTFSKAIQAKAVVAKLSTSVTTVLAGFDSQRQSLLAGTFVPAMTFVTPVVAAGTIPDVSSFFSFSSLHSGQPIPASFGALIDQRKKQLQQLVKSFSAIFSSPSSTGVSVTENTNPLPYPLPDQIDVPDVPRLAQGGTVAQSDAILKDKVSFAVHGVPIGAGKPNFWSRVTAATTTIPGLNPTVNQVFKDRNTSSSWSEPPTPYAAQFPYNHVQQTEAGHVFELDDTPGAERVHIFHRAGSFIEWHPDGSVVFKCMKDGYQITMADQHVKVCGACHVSIDGDSTLHVKGDVHMQTDGDFNVQAKGDYNVFASNINLRAKNTFKGDGTLIDLRYIILPYNISLEVPTGIPFPRVNIAAVAADFPGVNLDDMSSVVPSMDPKAGSPVVNFGTTDTTKPQDNPLSNWSAYTAVTPAAVAYRAKFFDTPEEVKDVQNYSGHTGLQTSLGDTAVTDRQLGGVLSTVVTGVVVPPTKPTVNYLNFSDYKGTFNYANDHVLAGTTFVLSDVADLGLYPDIVSDITPTSMNNFEDTPPDAAGLTGGGGSGGGGGDDGSGGGDTSGPPTGEPGSRTNPIIPMSADPAQIARDVRASLAFYGLPESEDATWIGYVNHLSNGYSDRKWHIGWNRYEEVRAEPGNKGSADPSLASLPAIHR